MTSDSSNPRMPTVYLPHGGGPWPWMESGRFIVEEEKVALSSYLTELVETLPRRPRAVLVISAHWEETAATVMTNEAPPLFYDYYGFPAETYQLTWPAPGDPRLAARVRQLLSERGIASRDDPARGFDHGTFVPLKLIFPNANVPTVQLSLMTGLDPKAHLELGRALAPLRDEEVFIVGSGMSYHNMQDFMGRLSPDERAVRSAPFDTWLRDITVQPASDRDAALATWEAAPSARVAHPREEHLLPLMVVAGAALEDRGRVAFHSTFSGFHVSGLHFG